MSPSHRLSPLVLALTLACGTSPADVPPDGAPGDSSVPPADAAPPPADAGPGADAAPPGRDAGPDGPDGGPVDAGPSGPPSEARQALRLAVGFYGAQRCGDAHNWLLADHPLGPRCHLQDGPALRAGLDLTGGWHDAGDFLKFTLTQAYAAYVLLTTYDTFGGAFEDRDGPAHEGRPNGVPDVLDEVRIATDYLLRAHPDANTLVARVGGEQDHSVWVTSPYQSTLSVGMGGGQRPVIAEARADVAGLTAAALALMARLYRPYDAALADRYLDAARSVYALGEARPGLTPDPYYPTDEWRDKMMAGAVALHAATGEAAYLDDATAWDEALGSHGWVPDWSNAADWARHGLAARGDEGALTRWRTDVDRYLGSVSSDAAVRGLAFFGNWGSLRYATHAALSAALLDDVTGEARYRDFALGQLRWVLGDNDYGRSFVVGFGTNPPTHPHHANAYGYDALDWDLSKPFLHSLDGALVGGPTRDAVDVTSVGYEDDIADYVGNEVTLDYNSGLVGAAAFAVSLE